MTTDEQIIAAAGEPVAYHENGRWSFNSDGGPDKWRERKKYNGPLYAAPSIPQDYKAQLDEANNERKWVRRKLNLPEDTGFLTGEVTLAGTVHNVCSGNHGYRTYIEAEKCEDKSGRIARLTVQLAESQAREAKLREALNVAATTPHMGQDKFTLQVQDAAVEALAEPPDATALNELIAKAGEVMRYRAIGECWYDATVVRIADAIRALPGVTLEDLNHD